MLAYATPVGLVLAGEPPLALLPLASAPLALALRRVVYADGDARRLNPVLKETARLSLLYAALFAVGLAAPGVT